MGRIAAHERRAADGDARAVGVQQQFLARQTVFALGAADAERSAAADDEFVGRCKRSTSWLLPGSASVLSSSSGRENHQKFSDDPEILVRVVDRQHDGLEARLV